MSNSELRRRLRLACLIVLAAGLSAALLIYLVAEEVPDDSLGYVAVNGAVYPLPTRDSKTYRREVQRFGGKAAVVFDDFSRWFAVLWQGMRLATTVACRSLLVALGLYLFANSVAPDAGSQSPKACERDEPG